jgi:hypothetical protein
MNIEALPKFFRKGIDVNTECDKITVEKTERSGIVEQYKQILNEKLQKEMEEPKPSILRNLKERKKSKKEDEKIDFSKNMIDIIKTVNDAFKPTYGVEIKGKNLNISESQSNVQSQEQLGDPYPKLTTVRDEETGEYKIKALPYSLNPKLEITISRKEYLENGVQTSSKAMMNTLISNKRANQSVGVSPVKDESMIKKLSGDKLNMTSIMK